MFDTGSYFSLEGQTAIVTGGTATFAPAPTMHLVIASPSPVVPPVTIAVCPSNEK